MRYKITLLIEEAIPCILSIGDGDGPKFCIVTQDACYGSLKHGRPRNCPLLEVEDERVVVTCVNCGNPFSYKPSCCANRKLFFVPDAGKEVKDGY